MKRFVHRVLIAFPIIVIPIGATVGFLFWWLHHDFIDQTSGPVAREKAIKHCPIPLPASARNIQYASFTSGMQCVEMFVRFEAPASDCRAFAQTLFAAHARSVPAYCIPDFRATTHPGTVTSTHLRTEWFDTDRISDWIVAGKGESWEPRIWIDEKGGVFYYYVTD